MSIGSVWRTKGGFTIELTRRIDSQGFEYEQVNGSYTGSVSIECLNKRFTRLGAQA